jgi:hypothetical protein
MLKRRDEGELDRLAPLVAGLGPGESVLDAEHLVRIGLQPHRLNERRLRVIVGIAGRTVVGRQHPPGSARDQVEADIGRDLVEPRAKRASSLESFQPPPRPQEGFLEGVLGVVDRAQHPIAVSVELLAVGLDEAAVGVVVAPASRLQQLWLPHARA